ncbi:MAG TPA: APC family permease [Polyangiaceae bacterium]|nr:APC family permease [Polyangiaceae bacterium]
MSAGRVGALSLLALGINGVVGVGIFFTPNLIAELVPGRTGALVYLATGALLVPIALTFSVLATRLGLDGGPYVWARAAFGERVAFGVGWVTAISALLSTAAVLAGLRDHLAPVLHVPAGFARVLFTWACVALLAGIASLGLRPSAWTWDVLTLLKLLPLAALLFFALLAQPSARPAASGGAPADFGRALLIAVFPLQGFEVVPVLAGSARGRGAIVFATAGSLLFAAALYSLIQLACVTAAPDLAAHPAPIVEAAKRVGGAPLMGLVSVGTNLSAFATAFGMIVMTPRYVAALGSDGGFSARLAALDQRSVPRVALLGSAVLIALLASSERLGALFVLSSSAVLLQYVSSMASLVRLSWRGHAGLSRAWIVPALSSLLAVGFLAKAVDEHEVVALGLTLLAGALAAGLSMRAKRHEPR